MNNGYSDDKAFNFYRNLLQIGDGKQDDVEIEVSVSSGHNPVFVP
jgi:hypothetical protein